MNKKVTVTADAAGSVVVVSQNPEFGYIRVEQKRMMVDESGWLRMKNVSALIHGKVAHLKEYGWKKGEEIPGKILVEESLTLFKGVKEEDKIRYVKVAGKTGIVCTFQDAPIYRRHNWDESGLKADELVQHDNIEQIRAAFAELEAQEAGGNLNDPEGEKKVTA